MSAYNRIAAAGFWLCAFIAYLFAVMPKAPFRISDNDKLEHMTAFFVLSVLARVGYARRSPVVIGLALAAFGALIEVSQMIPALHRDASFLDWLADMSAIVAGLLVAQPILALFRSRQQA